MSTRWPDIISLAQDRRMVLASASPRRKTLLEETGIPFLVNAPHVPEIRLDGEPPFPYAERLAREKATAIAKIADNSTTVIGCDTIVVVGNDVLEKPFDANHAAEMLARLRGTMHVVCTAVALAESDGWTLSGYETTAVFFKNFTNEQIREYVATGEPLDKAGAYGIQGMGAFLVDRIEGNLDTVVGLPRDMLNALARERSLRKQG